MLLLSKLKRFFNPLPLLEQDSVEKVDLVFLEEWINKQELYIFTANNFSAAIISYLNKLKECGYSITSRMERSADKPLVFNDILALVSLLQLPQDANVQKVTIFNQRLERRIQEVRSKIEHSAFAYEYTSLLSVIERTAEQKPAHPLLQQLTIMEETIVAMDTKIHASGWYILKELRHAAAQLHSQYAAIKQLRSEKAHKADRLRLLEERQEQKDAQLQKISEDPAYLEFRAMRDQKDKLNQQLTHNRHAVLDFFDEFKNAFIQLSNFSLNPGILKSYIEKPLHTFYDDPELQILSILLQIRQAILTHTLLIPIEEAKRLILKVELASAGYLGKLQKEYHDLQGKLKDLTEHYVVPAHLEDMYYKLDHYAKQKDQLKRSLHLLLLQEQKISASLVQESSFFENLVKNTFKKEISIIR